MAGPGELPLALSVSWLPVGQEVRIASLSNVPAVMPCPNPGAKDIDRHL